MPNKPSGLTESGKALQSLFYAPLRHSQHQPPGSLRVEYEGGPQAVHIGAHERTAGTMPAVGITARRNQAVRGERFHVVDKRQRGGVYLDDDPGTPRHLQQVPAEPKSRDIRCGLEVHGPQHFGGVRVQMGGPTVEICFGLAAAVPLCLDCGRQHACAERLGQHKRVSGTQPGVTGHGVRIHIAGHGQTVFDFRVFQRMPAGKHGSGLDDFFKAARQNLGKDLQRHILCRERRDIHRRPRNPTDGVHVRKRVRRRNLTEQPGIVAERTQHIHRLHQRHSRRRRAEDHGILVVFKTVQHAPLWVRHTRQGRQYLLQQLWSRLRRSAGGLGFVHQSERHDMLLE